MTIAKWHKDAIDQMASRVPTLFIRYEDLRVDPTKTLGEVYKFLLELDTLEGTNVERLIKEVTDQGHSVSHPYKQKYDTEDKKQVKPILFNRHTHEFNAD